MEAEARGNYHLGEAAEAVMKIPLTVCSFITVLAIVTRSLLATAYFFSLLPPAALSFIWYGLVHTDLSLDRNTSLDQYFKHYFTRCCYLYGVGN